MGFRDCLLADCVYNRIKPDWGGAEIACCRKPESIGQPRPLYSLILIDLA